MKALVLQFFSTHFFRCFKLIPASKDVRENVIFGYSKSCWIMIGISQYGHVDTLASHEALT